MIDYSNLPNDQFEKVFSNISDAILHYPYWDRNSNFFRTCCLNCGIIRYNDFPLDFYLVKKDYYDLLFCSSCWENIEAQSAKRDVKFDTKYYCYKEIIRDIECPELEQI